MKQMKLLHLGLAALFSLTAACGGDDDDGGGRPDADPNACPAHQICVDAGAEDPADAAPNTGPDAMPAAE
jgi:hypothetical protein